MRRTGVGAAKAGTLAFMCGGTEQAFAAAQTVLGAMGANIFRAGDAGAGQTAKICNNMLLAVHMAGTAEALQMGVNNGLDQWCYRGYAKVPGQLVA